MNILLLQSTTLASPLPGAQPITGEAIDPAGERGGDVPAEGGFLEVFQEGETPPKPDKSGLTQTNTDDPAALTKAAEDGTAASEASAEELRPILSKAKETAPLAVETPLPSDSPKPMMAAVLPETTGNERGVPQSDAENAKAAAVIAEGADTPPPNRAPKKVVFDPSQLAPARVALQSQLPLQVPSAVAPQGDKVMVASLETPNAAIATPPQITRSDVAATGVKPALPQSDARNGISTVKVGQAAVQPASAEGADISRQPMIEPAKAETTKLAGRIDPPSDMPRVIVTTPQTAAAKPAVELGSVVPDIAKPMTADTKATRAVVKEMSIPQPKVPSSTPVEMPQLQQMVAPKPNQLGQTNAKNDVNLTTSQRGMSAVKAGAELIQQSAPEPRQADLPRPPQPVTKPAAVASQARAAQPVDTIARAEVEATARQVIPSQDVPTDQPSAPRANPAIPPLARPEPVAPVQTFGVSNPVASVTPQKPAAPKLAKVIADNVTSTSTPFVQSIQAATQSDVIAAAPITSVTGKRIVSDRIEDKLIRDNTAAFTVSETAKRPAPTMTGAQPTFVAHQGAAVQPLIGQDAPAKPNPVFSPEALAGLTPEGTVQTATQNAPTAPQRLDMPTHVARQLVDVAQQMPNRPVDISLSPEELGRVRLSMSATEAGLIVTVLAERPETLDLMRRHIGTLSQEFQALGYDDVAFSFSGSDTGQAQEDTSAGQGEHRAEPQADLITSEAAQPVIAKPITPSADQGVDIRV